VTKTAGLFQNCKFLTLPDISNWDVSNVIAMRNMFYKCELLKNLPHIAKWDTINLIIMIDGIFGFYSYLNSLSVILNGMQ
jgi:surface protein